MAGINANQVYLPSPDQSATTGAVASAPTNTAAPSDARTVLPQAWTSGGYVDENGVSMSINRTVTAIRDWSLANVRKALTEFDGLIAGSFLQMSEFEAKAMLGENNVTAVAASRTAGNKLTLNIGAELPEIKSYVFSMKDGERRVRIYVPRGQITELPSEIAFTPGAANVWPWQMSCYDDGTGHSIYVFYDDGQMASA